MTPARAVLLDITSISTAFSGVRALDRMSSTRESGRLHALAGENGAVKSTLVETTP